MAGRALHRTDEGFWAAVTVAEYALLEQLLGLSDGPDVIRSAYLSAGIERSPAGHPISSLS